MKRYIRTSIDKAILNCYLKEVEDFIKSLGFTGNWAKGFYYRNRPMTITIKFIPSNPEKFLVRCDDTISRTSSTYFIDDLDFLLTDISNFKQVADNSGTVAEIKEYENDNVSLTQTNKGARYTGKPNNLRWNGL